MALKKGDFIEIEFTARTKDGEIFDSNIKEDLKNSNLQTEAKPFIFSLGQKMFLQGIEDFLIGKNLGKHIIELPAEKAFGKRNSKLIQRMSQKIFKEHNLNPIPGYMFNFDGRMGKILAVSGGRVIVDFNNPIAGKDVIYNVDVLKKIDKVEEKVKAINEFLFKKDLNFEINDKKLILKVEKQMVKFVEMFADKYKDIFGLELEVQETKDKVSED
jgi:FKBP-type peptidyl-prolyl cis-trans isomerase 2